MNYKSIAEEVFLSGVRRVLPDNLINKVISCDANSLTIGENVYPSGKFDHIWVIGAGKASALMAAEAEKILGDKITGGHIVVKYGHSCPLKRIAVTEAGHPVPDDNGFRATGAILGICRAAAENDLVICLLSGGGSALLADSPDGVDPGDMMELNNLLVRSGADISEINAVRKHLSGVKGGQLARAAFPATVISLILSDVTGDPLDVIASGPTVPDTSTFSRAIDVIKRYGLSETIAPSVSTYLKDGSSGKLPETPKETDPIFAKTRNILIGNNMLALEAAGNKARELGIDAVVISDRVTGDLQSVANMIVQTALDFRKKGDMKKPACLLFGGEPTIKVTGNGTGGRSQHLALTCAGLIRNINGITILSAGTDGSDGPTTAAGAVVDTDTWTEALAAGTDPVIFLNNFDSFGFFTRRGGLITTGPTMTNVMDIIVVIVE